MFSVLLFLFALLNQHPLTYGEDFIYRTFNERSCTDGNLICMGSATSKNGYLSLTPDPEDDPDARSKVGRVLHKYPVIAWQTTRIITRFTLNMAPFPNSNTPADGITFIMAPDTSPPPVGSEGGYLGIMNATNDGVIVNQLAVEFDTFRNGFTNDINNNHVGIDTTSISSPVAAKTAPFTLADGRDVRVQIEFDGIAGKLIVSMAQEPFRTMETVLVQDLKLSDVVPRAVYVGFTASTGEHRGTHRILDWDYISYFQSHIPSDWRDNWNIMYA